MYKPALTAGALFGALAVILGAFGAHALKALMPADQLAIYEKGISYQFYHSLALLATGIIYQVYENKTIRWATTFFIIGIALFSGSLYAMSLLSINGVGLGPVGIITPIGGLCFILGWICLFWGIVRKN